MVIRTREDALKALSEVLNLDRRQQIVQITVKLAQCLTPESRQILFRAQEGMVAGTLQSRLKARGKGQAPASASLADFIAKESVAPPEVDENAPIDDTRVTDEIGLALEALKVAAVAFDVYPTLRGKFARWEVARAAAHFGEDFQKLIAAGTEPRTAGEALRKLTTVVTRFRPWWHAQVPVIAQACEVVRRQHTDSAWRIGAKSLLDIVATTELRAMYAAKENIPSQQAMVEPLTTIYRALQRLVRQVYPKGLPEESALAE